MFVRIGVIEERAAVFNDGGYEFVDGLVTKLGCFLKIANDVAAKGPQVIDMLLNGLFRQARSGKVNKKWQEAFDDLLAGDQIAFVAHPTSGPLRQIAAVG